MKTYFALLFMAVSFLSGCANDAPLGQHVAKLKAEQTYNPDATQENLDLIPYGSGDKMDSAYQHYLGKKTESMSSSSSQVINGFK
ncbi:hypothetical protein JKP10_11135 [Vibrio vulnificus]|uniref:hypothetical protein n=1 Tax=Vibrio vulnificus TaxID=672 RepID=UPI00102A735D|nr:hypothetical protein [Vibrio vulnificus]EHU5196256.1 hypothetical protein [Vibrio vulnificus]EHY1013862.1 hypothetical protein [Vibrio vulnificus]EHY1121439.1 hypothetical protein [Vibrio vulnificus]EIN9354590.1 hypothetical protein [Vibrio vulnificus]EJR3606303.1 hypothetical protein [Vibrio vulnificus]